MLLLELALEKESDQHLNAYRPGGGGSGSHGKGYQRPRPGQGTTPKHARIMDNVKELFWCDARDEQGHLQHAPDCEQRDCFVVQWTKQETNTGAKAKMPDHHRCTITCAFCGKRKHYEDECYHKHLGFYGVPKSQNQLQSEILLFLSNSTIKSLFSGVSPPPTLQIGNFPAPRSTMQS